MTTTTTSPPFSSLCPIFSVCPESPASVHAKCELTVRFDQPCDKVMHEMLARITGSSQWVDPHNQGTYAMESASDTRIEVSHVTGNKLYTDKMAIEFEASANKSCTIKACSASQDTYVFDYSTNFCNLRNLYCNSKEDGCPVVNHELTYRERYHNCWQRKAANCNTNQKSDI